MITSNSYVVVDLGKILGNYRRICQKAGKPVMAVVKADAYGHGAVSVAKALEPECPFFGVSSPGEAFQLRKAGIEKPILILSPADFGCVPDLLAQNIHLTVCNLNDAQCISVAAEMMKVTAHLHIAVDTGMSRIGFQVTEADADICAQIAQLPNVAVEGLFSHFATADETDQQATLAQAALFAQFDQMLRSRGLDIPVRHLENSAGIMNYGGSCQMVRAGIILYGLYPSDEVDKSLLALEPAMSWFSRITHVKKLEPGRKISYGGTFTVEQPMTVATVPVGYADGYRRCLSNRFHVYCRGKFLPILGRVCMDQMVVDVTGLFEDLDTASFFEVELMGPNIPVEAIAEAAGSFNYEQVCDIGRRVNRIYVRDGQRDEIVDYLEGEQHGRDPLF